MKEEVVPQRAESSRVVDGRKRTGKRKTKSDSKNATTSEDADGHHHKPELVCGQGGGGGGGAGGGGEGPENVPNDEGDTAKDKGVESELKNVLRRHHLVFHPDYVMDCHQLWHGSSNLSKKNYVRYFLLNYFGENSLNIERHVFHAAIHHDGIPPIVFHKSRYHWELDFNWTGNNSNGCSNKNSNDGAVLDYFNNYFCKTCNMDVSQFKILVLFNAHRLSFLNQKMILRIMESTFQNVKFIIVSDHLHRIDATVRSRCIHVRIPGTFDNEHYIVGYNVSTNSFTFSKLSCEGSHENIDLDGNQIGYFFEKSLSAITGEPLWSANSKVAFLDSLFADIHFLKMNVTCAGSGSGWGPGGCLDFRKKYGLVLEKIDQYFLACHTVDEFLKHFLSYIHRHLESQKKMMDLSDSDICCKMSIYVSKFTELENLSHMCEYQTYLLENCLTFYLLN
jgi:hypothetical protein